MESHSNHTQVVRSSAILLSCRVRLPGVGALHPCKETGCDTEWNLSNDHRLSKADKYQQAARTRRNRPITHQESGGKSYETDSTNYGPKAPTQWTSRSGATPEIAEELHQMHWAHQHDGESRSHLAMERTTRAPGRQCAPYYQWWRTPPSWRRESLDNLEGTQPVAYTGWPVKSKYVKVWIFQRTRNVWLWHQADHATPTGLHMMDTACSPHDLPTANGIAIDCAKHWEGTIWRTYESWWKDKNDDDECS